jgi:spore coat protein U-like protein
MTIPSLASKGLFAEMETDMRTIRLFSAALGISGALFFAAPAAAGCSAGTAPVAFGNYSPTSGATLAGTGSITVTCDSSGNGTVILALSKGGGTSFATRRMASGANLLSYNLYTSAAHTTIFGDGSSGTATVTFQGANKTTVTTVYGLIPASQNVRAGAYADTIVVTVNF